ncbi:MAG: DNA polymerase IV [Patescibacteria group bacterium]|jgi:DNA polymerase-4/DNA polymerase V
MLQSYSWPTAILHLDGNAFFASVMQAVRPELQGKPVVVGAERGIATAISYEAKKYGVTRGMRMFEIKKICPQCVCLEGDYELFSLFSKRMFSFMRQYSPVVEEYSVDEGFADIYGLRRPLHKTYKDIGASLQQEIQKELGIPVSVGISLTKSLAKLASEYKKPSGLTLVEGREIENFLKHIRIDEVWGIGPATSSYLQKLGIKTALDFVDKPETFVHEHLSKPYYDIWRELRGIPVYVINPEAKNTYKSMSSTGTFHPATNDIDFLWSELRKHVETAFSRARKYGYYVKRMGIFLKTQQFRYKTAELIFTGKQQYPLSVISDIHRSFLSIYDAQDVYRTTGCTIAEFSENSIEQVSLFGEETEIRKDKIQKVYAALEKEKQHVDFGTKLWSRNAVRSKSSARLSIPLLEL